MITWEAEIAAISKLHDALRTDGAHLSAAPLFVLHCLMLNIGQIVSYPVLMEKLHDHTAGHVYNGTIRCNIKHVRKALRQADWPFVVKSIYGLGYRLEAETEDIAKGIRKGYSLATNVVC